MIKLILIVAALLPVYLYTLIPSLVITAANLAAIALICGLCLSIVAGVIALSMDKAAK